MKNEQRFLFVLVWGMIAGWALAGLAVQGPFEAVRGVAELQLHPARLINDFTLIAGDGAAMVNAALVAALGLLLVRANGIRLSGPTVAAVFTMMGFGLFGKTPFNVLPIFLGVYLSARFMGKRFGEYILMALFGTALGPLVTLLAVETGLPFVPALALAAGGGILTGFVLPPVAITMLRLHQGYNLYNIGLTSGFVALFASALVLAGGPVLETGGFWNTDPSSFLGFLPLSIIVVLFAAGWISGGKAVFRGLFRIFSQPGRLPSDYIELTSAGAALVNMSLTTAMAWGYVLLVGAPVNGPVIGGMLTIAGFSAFGKHPRNILPVLAGVVAAGLLFRKDLSAPGPVLGALFSTTLAPIAGEFGIPAGFIAGFIHLTMVLQTGGWHSGISLYNNGLAGGLTATIIIAVIEWYRSNKEPRKKRERHSKHEESQEGSV
ncbi:MAG: DUF1576 domain-containing protein [Spirochaetales bacterium]|nr:DUF1576 domain-containing protein [Spirochaetales bacterium]MCF7938336.1 DUF1576 domain-containing protein [Spirochaetales bacterium]